MRTFENMYGEEKKTKDFTAITNYEIGMNVGAEREFTAPCLKIKIKPIGYSAVTKWFAGDNTTLNTFNSKEEAGEWLHERLKKKNNRPRSESKIIASLKNRFEEVEVIERAYLIYTPQNAIPTDEDIELIPEELDTSEILKWGAIAGITGLLGFIGYKLLKKRR